VNVPALVFGLCLAASAACAALLGRAYLMTRTKLLLWTAVSFGFFAINNLVLVIDMLVLPQVDLWAWRTASAAAGLAVLLVGFIWEMR
jgi:hypothetical protein